MHCLTINDTGLCVAREAESDPTRSFAYVSGLQYEVDGETRRTVSLSLHGKANHWRPALYAAAYLSPDEARGLAARLLDAADEADERLDEPIEYALTGKDY